MADRRSTAVGSAIAAGVLALLGSVFAACSTTKSVRRLSERLELSRSPVLNQPATGVIELLRSKTSWSRTCYLKVPP